MVYGPEKLVRGPRGGGPAVTGRPPLYWIAPAR